MEIAAFWTLLEQSQLVTAARISKLKAKFESQSAPGKGAGKDSTKSGQSHEKSAGGAATVDRKPSAEELADWLIAKGAITPYHKAVLMAGHAGPFIYGDYQVQDRISDDFLKGSFKAQHVPTGHPVLLQFLSSDVTAQAWLDIAKRIKSQSEVRHEALVDCYEPVDLVRFRFVASQIPPSKRLVDLLESKPKLSARRASLLMYRIVSAVASIHDKGLVHGDLRPENIVAEGTETARVWWNPIQAPQGLFELAASNDPSALRQVEYMAPELATKGQTFNALTDIYALGVLYYRLLSGKVPFPGDDAMTIMQKHASQPIESLKSVGVPEPIEKIIKFMMAKQASIRFQSAAEVANQIASILKAAKLEVPKFDSKVSDIEQKYLESIRQKQLQLHQAKEQAQLPPTTAPEQATQVTATSSIPTASPVSSTSVPTVAPAATDPWAGTTPIVKTDPAEKLVSNRFKRKRSKLPIIIGICVLLLVGVATGGFLIFNRGGNTEVAENDQQGGDQTGTGENGEGTSGVPAVPTAFQQEVVTGNTDLPWETPTAGYPLDLEYCPSGLRMLVALRPAELQSQETGEAILQALGPKLNEKIDSLQELIGYSFDEIEQLVIGFHDNAGAAPRPSYRIRLVEPIELSSLEGKWSLATVEENPGLPVFQINDEWQAVGILEQDNAAKLTGFLVADPKDVAEVTVSAGAPPLLRQDLTQLLRYSDADRVFTLAAIPSSLFNDEGRQLFTGSTQALIEPLSTLIGDGVGAILLSGHIDQGLYLEAMIRGQLDQDPPQLQKDLETRYHASLDQISERVFKFGSNPYWDSLRMRFPTWLLQIKSETRFGVENGIVLANCWLPESAAHNLVLASELAISSAGGTTVAAAAPSTTKTETPQSLDELLDVAFEIEIPKNDMVLIVEEIKTMVRARFPALPFEFDIQLMGNDLQLEAITQNQSVRDFKMDNQPLSAILTELMVRANPVSDVTGPSDPEVKLVWVAAALPDEPEKPKVLITTRVAVARDGYELPEAFRIPE